MSSLKRILSSRANGARSRGPITPAGKQASSLNAIRHGLLAKCVVLRTEARAGFDILLDQHIQRYSPDDDVELSVVEEMAATFWRMRRAWAIETRLHDDAINAREPGDEIGRITGAFTDLAASPALALLHRYEARLHNIRQRAFKNIHLLRNTPPLPNEPTFAPPHPTLPPPPPHSVPLRHLPRPPRISHPLHYQTNLLSPPPHPLPLPPPRHPLNSHPEICQTNPLLPPEPPLPSGRLYLLIT